MKGTEGEEREEGVHQKCEDYEEDEEKEEAEGAYDEGVQQVGEDGGQQIAGCRQRGYPEPRMEVKAYSRRRDCHSADAPSPPLLVHLPNGEEWCSRMAVSSMAIIAGVGPCGLLGLLDPGAAQQPEVIKAI